MPRPKHLRHARTPQQLDLLVSLYKHKAGLPGRAAGYRKKATLSNLRMDIEGNPSRSVIYAMIGALIERGDVCQETIGTWAPWKLTEQGKKRAKQRIKLLEKRTTAAKTAAKNRAR